MFGVWNPKAGHYQRSESSLYRNLRGHQSASLLLGMGDGVEV